MTEKMLKKMHRKLAMLTHSDRTSVNDDSEFKNIQEAYETADVASLISACTRHDVNVDITLLEARALEARIESQTTRLHELRSTAHWMWCESERTEEIREKIRDIMCIEKSEFERWLAQLGGDRHERM